MVGYENDHNGDVYRMYNPETKKVILSRDVVWGEWNRLKTNSDTRINKFEVNDPIEDKRMILDQEIKKGK